MTRSLALLLVAFAMLGCAQDKPAESTSPARPQPSATAAPGAQTPPPPKVDAPKLDATKTFQYVKDLCAMGPRPVGSPAHQKMEDYIVAHLPGAQLEDDRFEQKSPQGTYPLRNIIAKFPGTKDGVIVLASHYDTKMIPGFVGANDGASSTALLLGLADVLRAQMKGGKRDGYSVWLTFFDGEEAFGGNINDEDGLYGSKHLAEKWQKDGTAKQIKAFLLADMIGDKDLNVLGDTNSTQWLLDWVGAAAGQLYVDSHFFGTQGGIIDDHIAFKQIGVPVVDLIDFEYGYGNAFWHTKDDTLDKLSPQSLQIVGNVMLRVTWMVDKK